jgi:hypothetical protein
MTVPISGPNTDRASFTCGKGKRDWSSTLTETRKMKNYSKKYLTAVLIFLLLLACGFLRAGVNAEQKFRNYATGEPDLELSIEEWMQRAEGTRAERIQRIFENIRQSGVKSKMACHIADLYLGRDVEETNRILLDLFTSGDMELRAEYRLEDHWDLTLTKQLYYLYYWFGSKARLFPGRITPDLERALLEELWERMKYKDDIHIAHQSTWWMVGSENHDAVSKVSSLISSQIFMNEPDFSERVYPDRGTGPGYGYWFHQMYGGAAVMGPEGGGSKTIMEPKTAADHYRAWVRFFNEYFTERARRGFFLEHASTGYMDVTITYLLDIFHFCEDPGLRKKARMFQDLVWCEWAQDALYGVKGGSRTRGDFDAWKDAMYNMSSFYFGGAYDLRGRGGSNGNFVSHMHGEYRIPAIVWEMAFDREGMGEYAYVSRKPGAEEAVLPRPPGLERSMLCDTEPRFVHYSWVATDYILGVQMDDPLAVHCHLSPNQHCGLIFKGDGGQRICPEGCYRQHVQYRRVMIAQQARRWMQINPDWYPATPSYQGKMEVYFGDNLDEVLEKEGWIFARHGEAYGAVKPVMGKYSDSKFRLLVDTSDDALFIDPLPEAYAWKPDSAWITLKDPYGAVVIEASNRTRHATLEDFMADILDNRIRLRRTVVPGWYYLHYKGCGEDAKEIVFNMATTQVPTVAGKPVNYLPERVFDSPYMHSVYGSGKIMIRKGDRRLMLDFNESTENPSR